MMIAVRHFQVWKLADVLWSVWKKESCKHKNKNIRKKNRREGTQCDDFILSDKSTMLWKKMPAEDTKHVCACKWEHFREKRVRESLLNVSLCLIIILKILDSLRRQMPKCECVCQFVIVLFFFCLRRSLCVISDTCFLPPATLLYDPPPPTA